MLTIYFNYLKTTAYRTNRKPEIRGKESNPKLKFNNETLCFRDKTLISEKHKSFNCIIEANWLHEVTAGPCPENKKVIGSNQTTTNSNSKFENVKKVGAFVV